VTRWGDLPDEMRGERIDDDTLDRLLRGHVAPDDAPPGYSDVASILLAAASPPSQEELRMQAAHVVAARDAIVRRTPHRRPGPLGLAMGTIAVAALFILPGLAVANVLHSPTRAPSSTAPATSVQRETTERSSGRTASHAGAHPASAGSEISSLATTTDATGVAKGAEISTLASGGKSQAGQHGKPAGEAPPVDTPNGGGTGTGDTASGGAAGHGSSVADEHSGGHSAAGSQNASRGA
jgi:hypothetical protein